MELKFVGEYVEEVEHYVAYKLQNFISDIGGLLGLFMGCSVISIVEVFYLITNLFLNLLQKRRKNVQIIQVEEKKPNQVIPKKDDNEIIKFNKELQDKILILNQRFERLQMSMNKRVEKLERFNSFLEEF